MLGYLVRHSLKSNSGLARDTVTNDFAFGWTGAGAPAGGDRAALATAVENFFTEGGPGGDFPIAKYLANDVGTHANDGMISVYGIPDARGAVGSPLYTVNYGPLVARASANDLPRQAAILLALQGDYGALGESGPADAAIPTDEAAQDEGAPATHAGVDRLRSRHRGRIFLGPLNTYAAGPDGRPRAGLTDEFFAAVDQSLVTQTEAAHFRFSIWSRRDWAVRPALVGKIPNVFATVRKRHGAITSVVSHVID